MKKRIIHMKDANTRNYLKIVVYFLVFYRVDMTFHA